MKTAVYTICKNELPNLERWLHYGKAYTYRVLLDTGSTDGTWETLQELAKTDPNLLIQQRFIRPWKFDVARNYNLSMVPNEVDWCLSPDLDEFFTINTLDVLAAHIYQNPSITNLACARMDIYSYNPRVGPPYLSPTNKIHRRHDYIWTQPIYEHLWWKHDNDLEVEIYSPDIYLIHDQDFKKAERPELYLNMLLEEYQENPTNTWCLWYLMVHYHKHTDMENYVACACDFLRYHHTHTDDRYASTVRELINIYTHKPAEATPEILASLQDILSEIGIL